MDFLELAKTRFSCRKFKNIPVEDEKLNKILEAAQLAPTAKNSQPFKIWVAKSDDALNKIRTVTPCHFNANLILVLGGNPENAFTRPADNKNFNEVDASIIGTHIMLQIQNLGLGTTWVGYFDNLKLIELFPEMKNYNLIALFPIGYPADDAQPAEKHFKRKNISELVTYL